MRNRDSNSGLAEKAFKAFSGTNVALPSRVTTTRKQINLPRLAIQEIDHIENRHFRPEGYHMFAA